jgi:hypothetical protein
VKNSNSPKKSEEEFHCVICGKPLRSTSEAIACSFCGKTEKADYVCEEGHYVCESCRLASPETLVRKVCAVTKETDPMKVVLLLMKHPAVQMHGPEHHYIVSCALLAALRNLGTFEINDSALDEAIRRGRKVLLASCGLWGVCGAAAGVGIALSIATKANVLSDRERTLSMEAVSESLHIIAKIGGPRCCKASAFSAIQKATQILEREFSIRLPSLTDPRPCYFRDLNKECLGSKCPYFGVNNLG